MGNLTGDPELKYTPGNTPVANFAIAVNRRWKGVDGQEHKETFFSDCEIFGPKAETFAKYLSMSRVGLEPTNGSRKTALRQASKRLW